MKTLVFLLVLANLIIYAFLSARSGSADHPDGQRVARQLEPERIRIVGRGEKPPSKEEVSKGEPVAVAETPQPPPELCLSWEHLSSSDADRLASTLAEKLPGVRVERRSVPSEGSGFWVFIPPLANKAEADKKASELKDLGVKDFFVVPENSPNRLAISLGVFSNEKGAQDRLNELKTKGVRSAKAAPRPGKEVVFIVEARGPQAVRDEALAVAADSLPKSSVQDCK